MGEGMKFGLQEHETLEEGQIGRWPSVLLSVHSPRAQLRGAEGDFIFWLWSLFYWNLSHVT